MCGCTAVRLCEHVDERQDAGGVLSLYTTKYVLGVLSKSVLIDVHCVGTVAQARHVACRVRNANKTER